MSSDGYPLRWRPDSFPAPAQGVNSELVERVSGAATGRVVWPRRDARRVARRGRRGLRRAGAGRGRAQRLRGVGHQRLDRHARPVQHAVAGDRRHAACRLDGLRRPAAGAARPADRRRHELGVARGPRARRAGWRTACPEGRPRRLGRFDGGGARPRARPPVGAELRRRRLVRRGEDETGRDDQGRWRPGRVAGRHRVRRGAGAARAVHGPHGRLRHTGRGGSARPRRGGGCGGRGHDGR